MDFIIGNQSSQYNSMCHSYPSETNNTWHKFINPGTKLMKNKLLTTLAVALLAGPMAAQAQADYEFQLIDHPGGTDTSVFGINESGDVVGNGFADPNSLPFVYDWKKGMYTDVAPLAVYSDTSVVGINNAGVMVGSVWSQEESTESGFIRNKNGVFTVFSHPGALSVTHARAVNNKGIVTGYRNRVDDDVGVTVAGFIYDPMSNTFTDIIPEDDHVQSIAQGINSTGVVVGSAFFIDGDDPCNSSNTGVVRYGWRRATDGALTYFSVNGRWTAARGINDSDTIVGFVNTDTGTKGFVVVLDESQCQSITIADADLLAAPGAGWTFAQGITNAGTIVGSFDDGNSSHGFIATP